MQFSTVYEWADWMASLHKKKMDLGLERVRAVASRLDVLVPSCPVVIVGGTNGKGSTVAGLEAIYRAAGYRVGTFTSPYLFKQNEQVRVDGQDVSDGELCLAFSYVADALLDITLTQFEFMTLSALVIFKKYHLDILILEVGLGGRLDAVNMIDADVSIVTSIAIDHVEWLGDTREKIAREKAGIFRRGKFAVCGDSLPPQTLLDDAVERGALFYCQGKEFSFVEQDNSWSWDFSDIHYLDLPRNKLMTQNMATVLMAVTLMQTVLPVSVEAIVAGLKTVNLRARIEVHPGDVMEIYDVSHNPAAVALLAAQLRRINCEGRVVAVFSMLSDKDIVSSVQGIQQEIDHWYVAPLSAKRAAPREKLLQALQGESVTECSTIKSAYQQAKQNTRVGDCIVVFGSFYTINESFS